MPLCSLNEVDAYTRRAARGAGMSWGLADEAGRATRWLAEHGAPGPALAADLLEKNDGCDYASLAPVVDTTPWRAPGGRLCPVCTGAAISDRAVMLATAAPLHLGPIALPLLVVPFLAQAARLAGGGFEMAWQGARVRVGAGVLQASGDAEALHASQADAASVACCEAPRGDGTEPVAAVAVADAVWARLVALAHRTYVPASEASRARGAGAGTTDND